MFSRTLPILALLTLPFVSSRTPLKPEPQRTVYEDADKGSCTNLYYPTEATYRNGYQQFCQTYLNPAKAHTRSPANSL